MLTAFGQAKAGSLAESNAGLRAGIAAVDLALEEMAASGRARAERAMADLAAVKAEAGGARGTLRALLESVQSAGRNHRDLEQSNTEIYNSVEVTRPHCPRLLSS
jgi:hypothetical protein